MSYFKLVTINGHKYKIAWNGLYADHIALQMQEQNSTHPLRFVDIQQRLAASKMIYDEGKNKIAFDANTGKPTSVYIIPVIVSDGFVIPKTCYICSHQRLAHAQRKAGIAGIDYINDFWDEYSRQAFYDMEAEGVIADAEKAMVNIARLIFKTA